MSKRGREIGIDTGEEEVKKRKNATKDMDNDKHDKESDFSWATWQLIDPLLPTGGFAHSCGLEAAAHAGLVKGGDARTRRRGETESGMELGAFAMESVANAVAVSVPFVEASRLVFRGLVEQLEALEKRAESGGLEKQTTQTSTPPVFEPTTEGLVSRAVEDWINLDRRLASRLVGNAVATRASAATGTALLRAALAAFGENDDDEQGAEERTETHEKEEQRRSGFGSKQVTSAFLRLKKASRDEIARNSKLPGGHLPTVFGAACGALGFSGTHSAKVFAYLVLRDTLSAATRLNLVGPLRAAAVLRRTVGFANSEAVTMAARCVRATKRALKKHQNVSLNVTALSASVSPLLDTTQAGHDLLYSRLFNS